MGEEEKKVEEAKKGEEKAKAKGEEKAKEGKAENKDEKKKEGGGGGGGGEEKGEAAAAVAAEATTPPLPPPPEEVVMRVYMHCEGCAKKVKRILKGFDGVEEVKTDCRSQKVVVKGRKAAEHPLKVVERVQKKTGRKVELLSPIPPPPPPPPPKPEKKDDDEPKKKEDEEKPKTEDVKEEPVVISVVLKVHMHCEPCAQEIKRSILKMKGVQAADPDLKASQVRVKGVFDPPKLVEYVYKRTGKHATVVKQDPPPEKPPADKPKDGQKKAAVAASAAAAEDEKGAADSAEGDEKDNAEAPGMVVDVVKNGFYYNYPKYGVGYYPPQIFVTDNSQMFSDENPNACSVM